jgi:uncharacterized protein YhaN
VRIREISIDGFGVFAGQVAGGLGPGLNVFVGDNEAGKSTLLAFLRAILFGFPRANAKEKSYPPLRGGNHGGKLSLAADDGAEFTVERRPGRYGGTPVVTAADGTDLTDKHLEEVLGATSPDLFRNVYAFSLSELQSFDSLQGDGVKAALYGASAGTSVLALPRVLADLEREMGGLFKGGGRTPLLNKGLTEWTALHDRLRQAMQTVERYDDASLRLGQVGAEIAALQATLRGRQRQRGHTEALLHLWPSWLSLRQARTRLAELPPPPPTPFPENGVGRLEVLVGRRAERHQTQATARLALREIEEALAALAFDDRLLAHAEEARRLRDGAGAYEAVLGELERVATERSTAAGELQRLLEELGPEWTVERVRDTDRSIFAREEVRRLDQALTDRREAAQAAAVEARALSLEAERARQEEENAAGDTGDADADSGAAPSAIFAAIGWVAAIAAAAAAAIPRAAERGWIPPPPELPIDPRLLPFVALPFAVLGLLLVGIHLLQTNRHRAREAERAEVRERLRQERLETAAARREEVARAASEAEEARRLAAERESEARAEWRSWLEARELPGTLTAATALEALQRIGRGVELAGRIADLDTEFVRRGARRMEYEQAAHALLAALDRSLPAVTELSPAIRLAARECEEAVTLATRRADLETRLRSARAAVETAAEALAVTEGEVRELIAAAGATDEEDFRHLGRVEGERGQLRGEIQRLEQNLREMAPDAPDGEGAEEGGTATPADGADIARLESRLAALRREDLEEAAATLAEVIAGAEEKLDALRRERATLEAEQSTLASADDVARLRAEQERMRAEMGAMARQWARAAVAKSLLDEARLRFQRERQPRVLRDAGGYLRRFTGERYREVRARLDEEGVLEVVLADGSVRRPEQLSRGTAEQLYLALRFGYIVNHQVHGEALPIVMDEVLVNFDPARARLAAGAIAELAHERQVLFFTCHPATRDLLLEAGPEAIAIRIADGRATAYPA